MIYCRSDFPTHVAPSGSGGSTHPRGTCLEPLETPMSFVCKARSLLDHRQEPKQGLSRPFASTLRLFFPKPGTRCPRRRVDSTERSTKLHVQGAALLVRKPGDISRTPAAMLLDRLTATPIGFHLCSLSLLLFNRRPARHQTAISA
jgi:hypothetical protein